MNENQLHLSAPEMPDESAGVTAEPQPSRPAFDLESVRWTAASPNYLKVKFIGALLGWLLALVLCCIPLFLNLFADFEIWAWLAYGLPVAALVWALIDLALVPRRVKALGYSEQEDHLLVKQGVLIRKVTAVPYGRMQYVEVTAGPIDRAFGLAKLELHTAASNMTTNVVGISEEEAKHLRAVLTERGVEKMVAL